ncbi:MFS transporter [Corynebacterium sp. sy017]|uniref:MFS transporter n=1 Tax=unclassified Corynebacterium TaxID=2624378 RepID=UPI00118717C0|nr:MULTISPECIES: MFS transporter [unclassified Corynebacterium]MBP3087914.1 MFS transporter [Corynebacterium sp. sy017]QDZ42882.1 MHS family MFS transporter [Corynebacterium sp. sy039]TSD92455.1 MFS transporter [Corynebacterium sp. SY003]
MSQDSHNTISVQERRRVLGATLVGTAIEWYDFFIYAQAAGLVFATHFFKPAGDGTIAQILAWATLGISFLFRPLGAIIAGHLGDRYGRKIVLSATLILMGATTTLIGALPTYASIGIAAPILLVILRVLQGFSAGGEWGGAALLSVEHAPQGKRGYFGAFPQIGVPLGLTLATSVLLLLNILFGAEAYLNWAWRIPFLISFILVVVGIIVRRKVSESPVFEEIRGRKAESSTPLGVLLKHHFPTVLKAALIFAANNVAGYMVIAFMASYAVKTLGMPQKQIFVCVIIAAIVWTFLTLWSGALSDRIGRVQTFLIGYLLLLAISIPMWFMIDMKSIWLFALAMLLLTPGLALSYGPQSALYAEMFDREIRYSGVAFSYALGSILGGAFASTIAQLLLNRTGASWTIGVYLAVMCVISIIALLRTPRDLAQREL